MLYKEVTEMKNNFSKILGERLISISDVSRETGLSRTSLTTFYYQKSKMIRFETLISLCDYLDIDLSELIEYQPKKYKKG